MTTGQSGIELLSALQNLKVAAQDFSQEGKQPFSRYKTSLERLRATIDSLGQVKPAKRVRVPEDYVEQWKEFLTRKRERLEPRAVRYLCWEPDVATDARFQDYLDQEHLDLGVRSLQGLVRSCHARWSPTFATGPIAKKVRLRLESYLGANRLLSQWKTASTVILGPQGAEKFAFDMVRNPQPIKARCESWGVEEQSLYIQEAVRQATVHCRDRMRQDAILNQYLLNELLLWTGWPLQDFKTEIGSTILHPVATELQQFRESLKNLALQDTRLGDPRLPRNRKNWLGVPDEACRRFIEWLSRADIVFFFEHVLPQGRDPHSRKAFWLRYVSRVLMSRPLLNWEDKARLQIILRQSKEQIGHFGLIDGTTSAFLLDFGPIVVIEFSRSGNACHIYEKRVIDRITPDFWVVQPLTVNRLKQRTLCTERVVHRVGWQQEMVGILARYGIRSV